MHLRVIPHHATLEQKKESENFHYLRSFVSSNNHILLKQIMLEKKYDADICDDFETPLISHAVKLDRPECIRILLELNANPNLATPNGLTPLIFAVENGRLDLAKILIDGGALVDLKTTYNRTPLIRAVMSNRTNLETIRFLIKNGSDLNHMSYNEGTALTAAARTRSEDKLLLLLEAGAEINKVDNYGFSALMWASQGPNADVIKLLVKNGADVNFVSHVFRPTTALTLAAGRGIIDCCLALLDSGADVNAELEHQDSPLAYAAERGNIDVIKLLVSRGAETGSAVHRAVANGKFDAVVELINLGAAPLLIRSENAQKIAWPFGDFEFVTPFMISVLLSEPGHEHHLKILKLLASKEYFHYMDLTFLRKFRHSRIPSYVSNSSLSSVLYKLICKTWDLKSQCCVVLSDFFGYKEIERNSSIKNSGLPPSLQRLLKI